MLEGICELVEGLLDRWRGLIPFALADAPACLGIPEAADRYWKFGHGWARYRTFRRQDGADLLVRLFVFGDSLVRLVEVYGSPVPTAALVLRREQAEERARQGEAAAVGDWPLANELQQPQMRQGEVLREYVFGDAGLALLVGEGAAGSSLRLARLRGFEPMLAREYRSRYVMLPRVEFLPE